MYNAARCYERGRGVEKDLKKAESYYKKALDSGMKIAEKDLLRLKK